MAKDNKIQSLSVPARTFTRRVLRKTKYAIVPVDQLRAINPKDDAEVIDAANHVDDDMIKALEQMVHAAKAGKLEGENSLALTAAAWGPVISL
jgi:hypothetical protein